MSSESQYAVCRITYAVPEPDGSATGDDWLRLEQPEWQEPPEGGLFPWLRANNLELNLTTLSEYVAMYRSQCSMDGSLEVEIFVYCSRDDLNYTISASYGELSEATSDVADAVEYIDIGMEASHTLDTVPDGAITASWQGKVFGIDGSEILPVPVITVNGLELSWGVRCLGQIKLAYSANRLVHILTIVPRTGEDVDPEDPSTAYASTVTAFWGDGEYEQLEVNLPDLNGNCNRDGGTSGDDDDDEGCVRHVIMRDPCTDEILEEFDEAIPCPGQEEDEG